MEIFYTSNRLWHILFLKISTYRSQYYSNYSVNSSADTNSQKQRGHAISESRQLFSNTWSLSFQSLPRWFINFSLGPVYLYRNIESVIYGRWCLFVLGSYWSPKLSKKCLSLQKRKSAHRRTIILVFKSVHCALQVIWQPISRKQHICPEISYPF